jgi:MFS family permease
MLKVGFRKLAIIGTASLTLGAFLMSRLDAGISQTALMIFVALMGLGMGFSIPPFLIAVQTTVERRYLGVATSTMQFSRSIGGTLGVSVMGAVLTARLASNLAAANLNPEMVSQLLEPASGASVAINEGARIALANAIAAVFVIAFFAAALALTSVFFAPKLDLKEKSSTTSEESALVSAD